MNLLKINAVLAICWSLTACGGNGLREEPVSAPAAPPYMGEALPAGEAVIFAPGTVSVEGRYEYAVSIHPDGDRILFSVRG